MCRLYVLCEALNEYYIAHNPPSPNLDNFSFDAAVTLQTNGGSVGGCLDVRERKVCCKLGELLAVDVFVFGSDHVCVCESLTSLFACNREVNNNNTNGKKQ